jgi:hypothetical protein
VFDLGVKYCGKKEKKQEIVNQNKKQESKVKPIYLPHGGTKICSSYDRK